MCPVLVSPKQQVLKQWPYVASPTRNNLVLNLYTAWLWRTVVTGDRWSLPFYTSLHGWDKPTVSSVRGFHRCRWQNWAF